MERDTAWYEAQARGNKALTQLTEERIRRFEAYLSRKKIERTPFTPILQLDEDELNDEQTLSTLVARARNVRSYLEGITYLFLGRQTANFIFRSGRRPDDELILLQGAWMLSNEGRMWDDDTFIDGMLIDSPRHFMKDDDGNSLLLFANHDYSGCASTTDVNELLNRGWTILFSEFISETPADTSTSTYAPTPANTPFYTMTDTMTNTSTYTMTDTYTPLHSVAGCGFVDISLPHGKSICISKL